jgi:hypothetical protein
VSFFHLNTVLTDSLRNGGVGYHIKELRLAYRSEKYSSILPWGTLPIPFMSNYTLLARAERALRRHTDNRYPRSNVITVRESSLFPVFDPDSGNMVDPYSGNPDSGNVCPQLLPCSKSFVTISEQEKPLPSYIGGRVHARLVEAKARRGLSSNVQSTSLMYFLSGCHWTCP